MMLQLLFSLALLFAGASAAWISVRLPSGAWVALLEASRGRFLLHPRAQALRVNETNCAAPVLEVLFWRPRDLRLAELALRERQLCQPTAPCRVEPFQALRVALRDQLGVWRPRRRFPRVALPPVMRFALRRATNASCDLSGLVVEITGTGGKDVVIEVEFSRQEEAEEAEIQEEAPVAERRLRNEVRPLQAVLAKSQTSAPLERVRGVTAVSDCADVRRYGLRTGVFYLKPVGREVVCSSTGELIVLQRNYASLDFNRNWAAYRRGFGDLTSFNFFLGLDVMSNYTAKGDCCMIVNLQPMNSAWPLRQARYSQFVIGPESSGFKLTYKKFAGGNWSFDPFAYQKGKRFWTPDKPDSRNCAGDHKSGNWFYNCNTINVFGRYNYTSNPHDGFFSRGLNSKSLGSDSLLRSVFMTLHKVGGNPRALSPVSGVPSPACPARVREWTAPETGEYLITAGGAPGGGSVHNKTSGGRGALVTLRANLKQGSKLRLVIGCTGGFGQLSGGGGDGTFVADMGRRVLLAAAGGGGGSGWTSGGPGQASAEGGKARLAPGIPKNVRKTLAAGWHSIQAKIFGSLEEIASTGGSSAFDSLGGGGGGGFMGGWAAADGGLSGDRRALQHSTGGGGGSFCNKKFAESCEVQEGGNEKYHGVLRIQAYRCF